MRLKHLKILLAVALFGLLFLFIDPRALVRSFSGLSFEWIVMLLLVSFVMVYVSALKWKLLLGEKASQVSTTRLVKLYFVGYFVNSFLPSFVAGDALRSMYLGRSIGQKDAAIATVLERATGLLMMLVLAFVAVWVAPDPLPQLRLVVTGMTIVFLTLAVLSFNKKILGRMPKQFPKEKMLAARERSLQLLAKPTLLAEVVFLSLLYHVIAVLNTWTCCAALGWGDVSILQLCIVVPIVLLVSSLPITPSGLGLQEGAFFYFLKKLGATSELALGVGLLLRAKTYVLAIVGGVFWLLERKKK